MPVTFKSWCLNAPVPLPLPFGWVGSSEAPVLSGILEVPSGTEPQVPDAQGLSSLLPSSASCHPLQPGLGVGFWNDSHQDTSSEAFPAHRTCRRLTCSPRKDMSTSEPLEPENVTLFGKGIFADVIKDLEIRSSWITQVDPRSRNWCPYKTRRGHTERGKKAM